MPTICVTAGCSNQKDEAKGISKQKAYQAESLSDENISTSSAVVTVVSSESA